MIRRTFPNDGKAVSNDLNLSAGRHKSITYDLYYLIAPSKVWSLIKVTLYFLAKKSKMNVLEGVLQEEGHFRC